MGQDTVVYNLDIPKIRQPILVSVPHAGTNFPPDYYGLFKPHLTQCPPDTDWFVDELYDFTATLGISRIVAKMSRYVVDLNRNPNGSPLYQDDRLQTGATPLETFAREGLFNDQSVALQTAKKRLELFHKPYHNRLHTILDDLQKQFGKALLFDAHSIKRRVASLSSEPFPDCILGNRDGTSCPPTILEAAAEYLRAQGLDVAINQPFKGGFITESCHDKAKDIFSLQLEMCQDLYMDEPNGTKNERFDPMKLKLKGLLHRLIEVL